MLVQLAGLTDPTRPWRRPPVIVTLWWVALLHFDRLALTVAVEVPVLTPTSAGLNVSWPVTVH